MAQLREGNRHRWTAGDMLICHPFFCCPERLFEFKLGSVRESNYHVIRTLAALCWSVAGSGQKPSISYVSVGQLSPFQKFAPREMGCRRHASSRFLTLTRYRHKYPDVVAYRYFQL